MKKEEILSLVRHTLTGIGAIMIQQGVGSDILWAEITGSALAITGLIWAIRNKRK